MSATETLGKLFGSISRIKLMKFFLMHEEKSFDKDEIKKITKIPSKTLTKELGLLEKADFLKKKNIYVASKQKSKSGIYKKKKVPGYELDTRFRYNIPLKNLLCGEASIRKEDITKCVASIGRIKAVVISGIFIQDPDSRIDILIAGDNISETKVKKVIASIESEIGKEVRYAFFETADLKYRISVCDRLVRDIFDYPHQVIVDRIGIE
jgi:hypothetical protein